MVTLSTCAEYVALSDGTQILAGISIILIEDCKLTSEMKIYSDNQTAILIASDNASKEETKYLIIVFYFVNDFVRENNIKVKWTDTTSQQADIFTKKLGPNKTEDFKLKLGLKG